MNTIDLIANVAKTEKVINEIQSRFYEVIKSEYPDVPRYYKGVRLQNPKKSFTIHNAKTGLLIAEKSMGKTFLPMQQQELLDNILTTVHQFQANLDLDTLKFNEYCGGSKIEFTIETEPLNFVNAKSIMDKTNIMLSFTTSYDGSKSNRYSLFIKRVVCENGMTVKEFQGELKGRNTIGGKVKILSYAEELAKIINGADKFKEKMIALDKIQVTKHQIEAFKLSLFGFNAQTIKTKIAQGKKENKTDQQINMSVQSSQEIIAKFDKAINEEFPRTGQTAYGLLQATTFYTNHLATMPEQISQEEYIRFFMGGKTNDKAQDLLFALLPSENETELQTAN